MSYIDPTTRLLVKRFPRGESLPLPRYQTPGAAGMDLHAAIDDDLMIWRDELYTIPTGIAVEIPHGFEGQIRPRSSLGRKGIIIPNAPGTIDCDYRDELKVLLVNIGLMGVPIKRGDRIAQLIIAPVLQLPVIEVDALSETARTGGFGSTGT